MQKFNLPYKSSSKAFTLIELLVVVLIIGILAALALPQYKLSVEKTKAVEGIVMLKALSNSIDRVALEKGSRPTSFDELDISIPDLTGTCVDGNTTDCVLDKNWQYQIRKEANRYQLRRRPFNYLLEMNNKVMYCDAVLASNNVNFYRKLCKSLTGQTEPTINAGDVEMYAFP